MLDQLFESLEGRSLLSVSLLTGAPADAATEHEAEIVIAADADSSQNDDQMYRFVAGEDDAIYESGDDADGTYGLLAADVAAFDAGWDGSNADADEVVHPWIGLSDGPGPVEGSALVQAVEAAHKPTAILPDKPGKGDPHDTTKPSIGKADAAITFDFSSHGRMPSYRGVEL